MFALCAVSLYTASAWADLVHVVEQREVNGVTTVMRDETKITGMPWAPAPAPSVDGAIFTHWTISTQQDFAARDAWGRAYDAPRFKLYEDTTLTAHDLPATRDTDGDGVPDGYELYWYGNLDQDAASDTDGDGFTFAEEIANGTNPLMRTARSRAPSCMPTRTRWRRISSRSTRRRVRWSMTRSTNGLDLAQGSLAALDGLTLDVPPTGAVSCAFGDVDQDGIVDLLVSDAEGRIWFYKRAAGDVGPYHLQHKVWAGSHAGFAPGLTIALVDWDGDGDLDCVCGLSTTSTRRR